jgi:hypothetical protein
MDEHGSSHTEALNVATVTRERPMNSAAKLEEEYDAIKRTRLGALTGNDVSNGFSHSTSSLHFAAPCKNVPLQETSTSRKYRT